MLILSKQIKDICEACDWVSADKDGMRKIREIAAALGCKLKPRDAGLIAAPIRYFMQAAKELEKSRPADSKKPYGFQDDAGDAHEAEKQGLSKLRIKSRSQKKNKKKKRRSPSPSPSPSWSSSGKSGASIAAAKKEEKSDHTKHSLEEQYPADIKRDQIKTEAKLGQGQFAVVYKGAYSPGDGHDLPVALKGVRCDKPGDVESLMKEKEYAQKMKSPFLMHCYGHLFTKLGTRRQAALVLELCEVDLLEHLRSLRKPPGTPLSDADAVRLVLEMSSGLAYMHRHDILHQDVAARNVMLNNVSDQPTCKLCDFGENVVYRDHKKLRGWPKSHTAVECIPKPPIPFSPTKENDIWALGVTIFELLSGGCHPYVDEGTVDLFVDSRGIKQSRMEAPEIPGFVIKGGRNGPGHVRVGTRIVSTL